VKRFCVAFILLATVLCSGAEPLAGRFSRSGFSFAPPAGFLPTQSVKPDPSLPKTPEGDQLLAGYVWKEGKAYLYVTEAKTVRNSSLRDFVASAVAVFRKKGFSDIQQDELQAKNAMLPTIRAMNGEYVVLKSMAAMDRTSIVILDVIVLRNSFNDIAQAIQDSLQSVQLR
jgi:hypothetical protein